MTEAEPLLDHGCTTTITMAPPVLPHRRMFPSHRALPHQVHDERQSAAKDLAGDNGRWQTFPSGHARVCARHSGRSAACVRLTFPGMIDEPGSFFGISNSAKPARGPHDISLMSKDPNACLEARGDFRSRTLLFIEEKNSGALRRRNADGAMVSRQTELLTGYITNHEMNWLEIPARAERLRGFAL
jgi:hypothetical protein